MKKQKMSVTLDTRIRESLYVEGLVNEVIHQIQQKRKNLGLKIMDSISVTFPETPIEPDANLVKDFYPGEFDLIWPNNPTYHQILYRPYEWHWKVTSVCRIENLEFKGDKLIVKKYKEEE